MLDFPGNVPCQREWFRTIFEAAGTRHLLQFVDCPDDVCKAQLQKRNVAQLPGPKVMLEEEFEHITSFFVEPSDVEQFNVKRYVIQPV